MSRRPFVLVLALALLALASARPALAEGRLLHAGTDGADPVRIGLGGIAYRGIAAGDGRFCGITATQILCARGDGTQALPIPLADARTLVLGPERDCALTGAGAVMCWTRAAPRPVPLALPEAAAGLAVGESYVCVLAKSGGVFCGGRFDTRAPGPGLVVAHGTTFVDPHYAMGQSRLHDDAPMPEAAPAMAPVAGLPKLAGLRGADHRACGWDVAGTVHCFPQRADPLARSPAGDQRRWFSPDPARTDEPCCLARVQPETETGSAPPDDLLLDDRIHCRLAGNRLSCSGDANPISLDLPPGWRQLVASGPPARIPANGPDAMSRPAGAARPALTDHGFCLRDDTGILCRSIPAEAGAPPAWRPVVKRSDLAQAAGTGTGFALLTAEEP